MTTIIAKSQQNIAKTKGNHSGNETPPDHAITEITLPGYYTKSAQHFAALHLTSVLQRTLEPESLLELFFDEVKKLVDFIGVKFISDLHSVYLNKGVETPYQCSYRLKLNHLLLGEILFYSKAPFRQEDTLIFEYLMCSLLYPLRNAYLYQDAVINALTDPLTGVNNRGSLDSVLKREIELARRHHTTLSILILDIDRFKSINDRFGHSTGDQVLKNLVATVARCCRSSDMLFRYGGEEFILLLSNTKKKGSISLAERIRKSIQKEKLICNNTSFNYTVSIGVACLEKNDDSVSLFNRADAALYHAKANGRNQVKAEIELA